MPTAVPTVPEDAVSLGIAGGAASWILSRTPVRALDEVPALPASQYESAGGPWDPVPAHAAGQATKLVHHPPSGGQACRATGGEPEAQPPGGPGNGGPPGRRAVGAQVRLHP